MSKYGGAMEVGYEVTDSTRAILSVKTSCEHGQMTIFGPRQSKMTNDPEAVKRIELIMEKAAGLDIVLENGSFVVNADLAPHGGAPVQAGFPCPVTDSSGSQVISVEACDRACNRALRLSLGLSICLLHIYRA